MREFDQYAAHYEDLLNSTLGGDAQASRYYAESKARYLKQRLARAAPRNVLDFGCGVGLLAHCLRAEFPQAALDGFDVSPASIAAVSPALTDQGVFTDDGSQLRPPYDAIVVANVLHHIPPPERAAMAAHMASMLAPGGVLVVFEHNPRNPLTRRVVAQCPFDEGVILLPPSEVRGYAQAAGLVPERRDYVTFFPPALGALRSVERLLHWLPLGAQYALLARRPA